ncbi:RES family NAD+ phosphorylase [Salmonella enterica subsp. enterica serovar Pomona]|nr:RES domain-containing protein [Salmonella enterica subsp. enterica serovar Infantis]EFV3692173.1 RES family NAD+ phosphorylase [Salmonella enterica]EEA0256372.1 RES domain-containing protein [Salmonella enterica subsp. enterica serovar Infantis]EEF2249705.1 RES domain-containing protein [Salmonella enterica subsp. enterica serovar Infantis]EFV3714617.1 RES family NAD+ phosphorylase [Salmonella enterica]
MILYRLTKTRYLMTAWSGLGAKEAGGRWNSVGTAMVYLSETASLTMLETLVHINAPQLLDDFTLLSLDVPDEQIQTFDMNRLPDNWASEDAPAELALYGDNWAESGSSIALRIPSALSPVEFNYLLNPAHLELFDLMATVKKIPFRFDSRLK